MEGLAELQGIPSSRSFRMLISPARRIPLTALLFPQKNAAAPERPRSRKVELVLSEPMNDFGLGDGGFQMLYGVRFIHLAHIKFLL